MLDRGGDWGRLRALPPARRWVLEGETGDVAWPGGLPQQMLRSTVAAGHAALMLGPDEWLLLAQTDAAAPTAPAIGSLVEISDRNLAFEIAGPSAATVLNAGCPLDLTEALFPAGMATRTVFGKAEIVLWRSSPERWRIEVWRSFAPYLTQYLEQAIEDLA